MHVKYKINTLFYVFLYIFVRSFQPKGTWKHPLLKRSESIKVPNNLSPSRKDVVSIVCLSLETVPEERDISECPWPVSEGLRWSRLDQAASQFQGNSGPTPTRQIFLQLAQPPRAVSRAQPLWHLLIYLRYLACSHRHPSLQVQTERMAQLVEPLTHVSGLNLGFSPPSLGSRDLIFWSFLLFSSPLQSLVFPRWTAVKGLFASFLHKAMK